MNSVSISITYGGGAILPDVDNRIMEAMKSIGGQWYAQGMDLTTGKRDLAFDIINTRPAKAVETTASGADMR